VLSLHVRVPIARFLAPFVRWLARKGVSPDVVTFLGTVGVSAGALVFFTTGHFFVGTLVITAFVFSDLLDGQIARATGRVSVWGAFWDSALDRLGDAAIFGSLVIWYAGDGDSLPLAGAALGALVGGSITSYVKARAESLGLSANVGFAERSERLLIVLVSAGLYGLGVPYLLPIALWFLVGATTLTVLQRLVEVRKQAKLQAAGTVPTDPPADPPSDPPMDPTDAVVRQQLPVDPPSPARR
jgi:CDP-diacylglycerol--glycerol-3-phosphate 3-phosphatidyltransferase